MLTLGIETSCDETSVSVTDGGRVLSNITSSSVRLHKKYGGVVPEIASRFHVEYIMKVLSRALEASGRNLSGIYFNIGLLKYLAAFKYQRSKPL